MTTSVFRIFLLWIVLLNILQIAKSQSLHHYDEEIKNPCRIAKQRKLPKNLPIIRVIDELTGESPDVLLGVGGIQYYMLPTTTPTDVVIECSSSLARVEWAYRGRGASSGVKIVNTRWSSSSPDLKASCHSSALVISNITDQLTGEYTCRTLSTKSRSSRENSFLLFVPQSSPFYYKEGELVNITVPNWSGHSAADPIVLPCISKKRTAAGISLFQVINETENKLVKLMSGSHLKFDPFVGFQLTPTKGLFQNNSIAKFLCKFDKDLPGYENLSNTTLLYVNLVLQSDEKIAPENTNVRSFSPYFSWTTKEKPRVQVHPDLKSQGILWQQYFTKNDYEETSRSASIYHLGSLHLVNLTTDSEGTVSLYDGNKTVEDGLIYKWQYHVFDKSSEDVVGLAYEFIERMHIFTCISATEAKPNITFKQLFSDENDLGLGLRINDTENVGYTTTSCPKQKLGCIILTTILPQGEVTCIGDGVDRTIRFPYNSVEPARPFFIERGETIRVVAEDIIVTLPCLPNAPEAQYVVNLFKKSTDGYKILWAADEPTKASEAVEFYPNWGFHLDTSYPELSDPTGEYICTSSKDVNDRTDAIIVIVYKEPEIEYVVLPKESTVYGVLPFTFRWESEEELEILEYSYKNVTIKQTNKDDVINKWKFILLDEMTTEENINVTLIRKSDKTVVHSWQFHKISKDTERQSGLKIDTAILDNGEHRIVLYCRSKSSQKPVINYYFCQSPNSCDLMKRCSEKNCNSNNRFRVSSEPNETLSCLSNEGCSSITLISVALNGYLKASCIGDGVNQKKTISDVFFREDIHWNTGEDHDLIYLYVNSVASTDQNPQREIRNIGTNVDWEIGDTIVFTCAAAPYLFSNGVKWAVETKDGVIIYQKDNIFDPQFKYSGPTQVLSSFSLLVDSFEIKRVWCFVPSLSSPVKWRNFSQPIFIRPEIEENCYETDASIRLLNIYPPLSKTKLDLDDPRLDKKPFFVLPNGTKQFSVRVTAPEPLDWIFTGYGAGPSMTPLIQSDRKITDFYDTSTYCYTSKLLINLRFKNSNDTGRYVAKFKYHPETFLSFYLFIPSYEHPYLVRSGSEVNETWTFLDKNFYLPCLVNNPEVKVDLLLKNNTSRQFEAMNESINYDPTVGYIFLPSKDNPERLLGTYKCIANGNQDDFLIVNVQPQTAKKGELKFEKVGEINIFTCLSATSNRPIMNFTSLLNTTDVSKNSSNPNQIEVNLSKFTMKECPDGCLMLMTTSPTGKVHCIGDGIDETYKFPNFSDGNYARKMNKQTGLWYDSEISAFKCQTNSIVPPSLVTVQCRRPNECEVMQTLIRGVRGQGDMSQSSYSKCGDGCARLKIMSRARSDWPTNWFSIFVRCKGEDNMEIFSQYFQDKNETVLVTLDAVEKFRQIRLDVVSFRQEGNTVRAKFRCFANRYFYSRGFQWALEKQNGAFVFKENLGAEIEVQNFASTMSEIHLDFDENVFKAVWCFVPMLDSAKWANATISVPIDQLVYNF